MTGLRVNMLGDLSSWRAEPSGLGETNGLTPALPSETGSAVVLPLGPEPLNGRIPCLDHDRCHRRNGRPHATSFPGIGGALPEALADPRRGSGLATLANHAVAGIIGVWFGEFLSPAVLDSVVGVSMIAMAVWVLKPDALDGASPANRRGAFVATLIAFFIAEIGDKTQIATVALAAGYSNLGAVIAGTTCGMLLANTPVVFLGKAFATRLPLKAIHYGASSLFAVLGAIHHPRADPLMVFVIRQEFQTSLSPPEKAATYHVRNSNSNVRFPDRPFARPGTAHKGHGRSGLSTRPIDPSAQTQTYDSAEQFPNAGGLRLGAAPSE